MDLLQSIEERFQPFERSISRMIQGTLEYPASVEDRAAKIANDTIFLFKIENEVPPEGVFMSLWAVLVEMSWRIPAGHEWQRCLLLAIHIIRQREGAPNQEEPECKWHDLPELETRLIEHWELRPVQQDNEPLPQSPFDFWKNTNSFASHIVGDGFTEPLDLAFWELHESLENPSIQGPLLDCQVWVAAEWLINCSEPLLKKLTSGEVLSTGESQSLKTGGLYGKDLAPLSLQRWNFWEKRLGGCCMMKLSKMIQKGILKRR
uniref:Uncharacterized protein n=1 Tax=Bionectria ochroleuca TaxID=29856 RepID=A0A8H7NDV0_BIOOC